MRIIVEVSEMSLWARKALESFGKIANENPEDRSYAVELIADGDPERRRIAVETTCQRIGQLGFVTNVLLPGYRTLRPERWVRSEG